MNQPIDQKKVQPLYPEDVDDLWSEVVTGAEVTFPAVDDFMTACPQKLTKVAGNFAVEHLKPLTVADVAWPEIIYPSEIKARQDAACRLLAALPVVETAEFIWPKADSRADVQARRATYEKALAYFQTQPVEPEHTPEEFFRGR